MTGLAAYEQGQGFDVARVREHIEYSGGLEAETVLCAQDLGIAGQGRRMAGYIDQAHDPAQIQCLDGPQRPYPRRVDDDELESTAQDGPGRVGGAQIAGKNAALSMRLRRAVVQVPAGMGDREIQPDPTG